MILEVTSKSKWRYDKSWIYEFHINISCLLPVWYHSFFVWNIKFSMTIKFLWPSLGWLWTSPISLDQWRFCFELSPTNFEGIPQAISSQWMTYFQCMWLLPVQCETTVYQLFIFSRFWKIYFNVVGVQRKYLSIHHNNASLPLCLSSVFPISYAAGTIQV